MKITKILCKFFLDCKQGVQDSFYYWYQDRLEEKLRKLSAEWNQISRQCYTLEQRLRQSSGHVYNSVLKRYKETCARAKRLSEEVKDLKQNILDKRKNR